MIDEPSPSHGQLTRRLEELSAWVATSEYQAYLAGTRDQLLRVEHQILGMPPLTQEAHSRLLLIHGQRQVLLDNLTLFDDARAEIEKQLSQVLDEANQSAITTNTDTHES